jgi:hypothetical protein
MAIGTYSELQDAVVDWATRAGDDSLIARLPNLIVLTEAVLNKTLKCMELQAEADITTTAGNALVTLPANYQRLRSVVPLTYRAPPLAQKAPEALDEEFAGAPQGQPQAVSAWARQLRFGPVPGAVYSLRVRYYKRIPALSVSNTTNDVLTAHPEIYLYGALLQAAPTLKDQEYTALWKSAFEEAVDLANADADAALTANAQARRRYGALG